MSSWRPLTALAETNPDSLSPATPPDYTFTYIDLSSVHAGEIDWTSLQTYDFLSAPSRARRRVAGGDVLFGTVRPNLQSHGYIPESQKVNLVASTGFTVIRARPGISCGRYLRHCVLSDHIFRQSVNLAVGSNYPAVNDSDVRDFRIYAPPVDHQVAIANVLDSLEMQIQKTEALIAKLEDIKRGLLTDLLTRGIDHNGRLRARPDQAPELYKESPLGKIPNEWTTPHLGELLQKHDGFVQTGPFGSQLHADEYVHHGVPVVMPQDMRAIEVSVEKIAQITESRARDLARHRTQPNDVLFSRRGDLSRCCVMTIANQGWLCGTGCLLVRLPKSILSGYWLAHIYKQPAVQSQVYGMAVGSTMVNLNSGILASVIIALPPTEEQIEFEKRMKALSERIDLEVEALEKLKAKKSGLMDDLLTGRVRVTPILDTTG